MVTGRNVFKEGHLKPVPEMPRPPPRRQDTQLYLGLMAAVLLWTAGLALAF